MLGPRAVLPKLPPTGSAPRQRRLASVDPGRRATARGENEDARRRDALATALMWRLAARDPDTYGHSTGVMEVAGEIAAELGMGPGRVRDARRASLVHDVGKLRVPRGILLKPAALTAREREQLERHAELGEELVGDAGLDDEARWVRHHHERPDGHGYPDGLVGDEIPLESRIVRVADAFEAMTADRPYRRGRSPASALAELLAHAGVGFDAACVEALRRSRRIGSPRGPEPRGLTSALAA